MATPAASGSSSSGKDAQSAQDMLRQASFSTRSGESSSDGSRAPFEAPTANAIFQQANAYDPAALHPLANLSSGELDYLALEDGKLNSLEGTKGLLPSRGWGDELCYGTGTTYLAGLATGGLWGLREGLAKPLRSSVFPATAAATTVDTAASGATLSGAEAFAAGRRPHAATAPFQSVAAAAQAGPTAGLGAAQAPQATFSPRSPGFKLRLNTVLNSITRRGTFLGNNAGVLALIYNAINSSVDKYRGRHDIYGSMFAGAGTGAIWKSTAGLRPMLIASGIMTTGAAAWTSVKPYII
ncbi:uncharacterized protein L969DRAFT_86171 [Mixia osmundae IAM 14324]|uniref:Mitochondrial import inner membrane translocase subunit TIM23 n=1 Tax=Mixia osmundae (strain CBS 9802 / IAM 14324 / JCM 22182 / KY 12970) TaxID=764103 RepID=G7DSA8_MIXOS|nr:uncharacterized protein L969DRAFT_86171 [Mixia osmundae IAM 14324]KEI40920.1 hypothetical protein L969DRAFT_86171 [Mixia osmundae IAM 14324]GAA93468.1 hypothetical protein E5Q_00109 [Mixia osmundae IAM 14324]